MPPAPRAGMAVRHDRDPHAHTERIERVEHVRETPHVRGPYPAQGPLPLGTQQNVSVGPTAQTELVVAVTRVVTLIFSVLEVLLLLRFTLKLAGANANQPLVAALYGTTEVLVRPFQGIFPEPRAAVVLDLPALLAIVFLFLVAALVVALVRAIAGRTV